MESKINGLMKQNEAIYNSLKNKNVIGLDELLLLTDTMSLEQKLEILITNNNRLKELSKQNKPLPQPKPEKQQVVIEKQEDDDEDQYVEPQKKFDCLTNMEDMKRAFFGGEYDKFDEIVKQHDFKLYNVNYKYSSDKDGAPTFSAKNLVGGFVRNFDDLRKYFMICFRCFKQDNAYTYPSYWIVNSHEPLQNIIGSLYDDFEFSEVTDKEEFYKNINKINSDNENLVTENYVH